MPFCPECKVEYRSGSTTCTDCKVDLVEAWPAPSPEEVREKNLYKLDELAELADFSHFSEAEMIRELLAANQIESTIRGESDQIYAGSPTRPVTLLVEKHNLDSAREIYEAYFAGIEITEIEKPAGETE
jgi:elongation factor P--beta-lysine ligase